MYIICKHIQNIDSKVFVLFCGWNGEINFYLSFIYLVILKECVFP